MLSVRLLLEMCELRGVATAMIDDSCIMHGWNDTDAVAGCSEMDALDATLLGGRVIA